MSMLDKVVKSACKAKSGPPKSKVSRSVVSELVCQRPKVMQADHDSI